MRYLYSLLMYLVTPLIVLRLLTRGIRYGGFHQRWPERFGTFPDPGFSNSLWIHAVSMGEVNAAEPLINALRERYPDSPVVVTTVTPTGSERVRQLFGDKVFHVYLPYDLPFAVRRFLSRIRPRLGVIVETEIWPNLYFTCGRRAIPLMIVNARLSERSMRGYRAMRGVVRSALRCVQVGPHTFNFDQITLSLLRGGGGQRVQNAQLLGPRVLQLLREPEVRMAMGRCAREVFESERGAVGQVMALVEKLLPDAQTR